MTERELVYRLQQGDLSALDIIYALYAESALRTAYLITYSRHDAEDIVHAAFVQVIRSIKTLRDPAAFRGWFFRIVVNSAYKHCKRTTRLQPLMEPDELLSPSPGALSPFRLPDKSTLYLGLEVCGETGVAPSFTMVVAPKAREAKLKVLKYGAWNEAIQEKSVGVIRGSGVVTLDAPLDEGWYVAQLTVEVGGEPYVTFSQPFHVAPTAEAGMTGKLLVGKEVAAGDRTITLTALEMTPFGSTLRVSSPPGKSYDVILMADGVEIPGPDAKQPRTAVAVVTATSGTVSVQTESVEFSGRGVYNAALTLQVPSAKLFAPVPAGTQSLDVKIVERVAHGAAASEVATVNVPISQSHEFGQLPTMEAPVPRRTDSFVYAAVALLAMAVGYVGKDVDRRCTGS